MYVLELGVLSVGPSRQRIRVELEREKKCLYPSKACNVQSYDFFLARVNGLRKHSTVHQYTPASVVVKRGEKGYVR